VTRRTSCPSSSRGHVLGVLAVVAALAAVDARAQTAAVSAHDLYASKGIACAQCHTCGHAAVHPVSWMDRSSPAFHAFAANSGLAQCQTCHGPNLDGVGGSSTIACATCHDVKDASGAVVTAWTANCVMCHGGGDNPSGAPPVATWGNAGDPNRGGGAADPVRAGAHTSHVGATHALSQPVACQSCHVTPVNALSVGHVDAPTAAITFAGLATLGVATPVWDRTSASCATT
jgi:hypothetical protein